MQINVHPRSLRLDGLLHPLDSLVLDIQLTLLAMCAHPLDVHTHIMPKSIVFVHTSIIEDNAFMWFPLAFQVQYLDFYICFIAYCVL